MTQEPTRPTSDTRAAEAREARRQHMADRPATEEEERRADEHPLDPDVAVHAREMSERGAHQQGEGRVP